MDYTCEKCGKTLVYDQEVSFCPFCGQAYKLNTPSRYVDQEATRIVLGSDSERTVQEKYWREAQRAMRKIVGLLYDQLPDVECFSDDLRDLEIDVPSSLQNLYDGNSFSGFKRSFTTFLSKVVLPFDQGKIQREFKKKDRRKNLLIVNIDDEEQRIMKVCADIVTILGGSFFNGSVPLLKYNIVNQEKQQSDGLRIEYGDAARELVSIIILERDRLLSIVAENSTFIIRDIITPEEEALETIKADELANKIKQLADKDYDPLLGEDPREYIQSYWNAVVYVAHYANIILRKSDLGRVYDQMRITETQEKEKVEALRELIAKWDNELTIQLDRTYQNRTDMISVYKELEKIEVELLNQQEEKTKRMISTIKHIRI